MDEHLETSWCPRCDRLIEPERITVELDELNRPINILNSAAPAPLAVGSPAVTRTRTATQLAPGLVRGTGRVQPNGALVTENNKSRDRDQPPPVPPPSPVIQRTTRASQPALPRRTRTVISQKQTPLYCSDKCRQRDTDNLRIQSFARRESDSTASTSSVQSIFDATGHTTSASSLDSYDVPPRDLDMARSKTLELSKQAQVVEVDHTLRWSNGVTGLGAAPPKRLNNVRAPSPEPLDFLQPHAARRDSSTSAHSAYSDAHTQAQADAEERADRVARANAFFAAYMPFPRAAERARLDEIDRARSSTYLPRAPRSSSSSSLLKRVKSKSNSAPALTRIAEIQPSKYFGVSPTVQPEPKHPEPMIWIPRSMTDAASEAFRNSWRRDGPPALVVWSGHGYLPDREVRQQCEVFGHPATFSAHHDVEESHSQDANRSPFHDPKQPTVSALGAHVYRLRSSLDLNDEAAVSSAILALPSYERIDLLAAYQEPTREYNRDADAMARFVGRRMVRREVAGPGVVGGLDLGRGGYDKAIRERSRSGAIAKGKAKPSREELELYDLLCEQWTAMRKIGLGWGCDERKRAAGEA